MEEGAEAAVRTDAGEAVLPVVLDAGLAPGTVYVPFNQPGVPPLGPGPAVDVTPA